MLGSHTVSQGCVDFTYRIRGQKGELEFQRQSGDGVVRMALMAVAGGGSTSGGLSGAAK